MKKSQWTPYFASLKEKIQLRDNINTDLVEKAFYFAAEAHKNQKRKTGDFYIIHPIAVAELIYDNNGDEESIIAALLHDTVEDTDIELQDIERDFGKNISFLVNGLTKISKNQDFRGSETKVLSLRHLFFSLTADIRIAIIKCFDRYDNISSLSILNKEQQNRIAKESFDIYVPLFFKLGMHQKGEEFLEKVLLYHDKEALDNFNTYKELYISKGEKTLALLKEQIFFSDFERKIEKINLTDPSLHSYRKVCKTSKFFTEKKRVRQHPLFFV